MEERLQVEKFEITVHEGKIVNVNKYNADVSSAVLDFGETEELEELKKYI